MCVCVGGGGRGGVGGFGGITESVYLLRSPKCYN